MAGPRTVTLLKGLSSLRILQRQSRTLTVDDKVSGSKPFESIPGPAGVYNIPAIGAVFHFKPFTNYKFENLHLLYDSLLDQYGPLVRVRLGQWTVLVEDHRDIEKVLRNEGKCPQRPLPLIHVWYCESHGRRKGIGTLNGTEWQTLRSAVNAHLLRPQSTLKYLPLHNTVADELVACMRDGGKSPGEVQELFYQYACESISAVVFNERLGYLNTCANYDGEKTQILKKLKELFQMINDSLTIPPYILMNVPLKLKANFKENADFVIGYVERYYKSVLEELEAKGHSADDVRENLVHSMMTRGQLSAEDMGTVALDLFAAGTDSTARAIEIFLYNIARNPDKQQLLYEEISQYVHRDEQVTKQSMAKLKYLAACVKESMRLHYPTMTGVQRYLPQDIVLQGYTIPAGTLVSLMNHRVVKNKTFFPSPESFVPERWLRDESGKRSTCIPTHALLPFGIGPRQCIGKLFAQQEIYLAIIKLIQNFEVELERPEEKVEFIFRIFMGPRHPIRFRFKER